MAYKTSPWPFHVLPDCALLPWLATLAAAVSLIALAPSSIAAQSVYQVNTVEPMGDVMGRPMGRSRPDSNAG